MLSAGGADIPLEYGGKDASEFWTDMHGHLEDEILEDVLAGEINHLADAGLEALPTFLGVADGPADGRAAAEATVRAAAAARRRRPPRAAAAGRRPPRAAPRPRAEGAPRGKLDPAGRRSPARGPVPALPPRTAASPGRYS